MTERRGPDDPDADLRPPPRPRWVIVLVIALAVAVLIFLGAHLLLGGHGPMQHMPGMSHGLPGSVLGNAVKNNVAGDAT
jgi:hypothetical protein